MIPNSECTNKHINKIQSNPSSFIDLNQQKTTPLNISVASNNSFRKKATQVFTTNTQVHGEHSFYPVVDPDYFDANLMGFKGYF